MPGKHVSAEADDLCRRCKANTPVLLVRSEPLCRECFARYVHTKTIKRLESFRVNFGAQDQQRTVLLPLSFGVSSVTLLHILDLHLKTQKSKTGRTGFAIRVVHIEHSRELDSSAQLISAARDRYPDHQYESLQLHELFHLIPENHALENLDPGALLDDGSSPEQQLSSFLSSLTSATARADVITTLRTKLLVEYAKRNGCESILWGDSTTKLAEKTLAETAKGRGFAIPWQVANGKTPFGIDFHFPLRDVLKKELVSYIELSEPELMAFVHKSSLQPVSTMVSSKTTTIDDLMKQYFESVEENFPSIVSNVVRTTDKLEIPPNLNSAVYCSLCGMPVPDAQFGIHGWGGDQEDQSDSCIEVKSQGFCYGCTRSIPTASVKSRTQDKLSP